MAGIDECILSMPVFCDIDGCLKGLMSLLKMFSIFKKGVGINVTFYCIMLRMV